jgi:hypothetical protein
MTLRLKETLLDDGARCESGMWLETVAVHFLVSSLSAGTFSRELGCLVDPT